MFIQQLITADSRTTSDTRSRASRNQGDQDDKSTCDKYQEGRGPKDGGRGRFGRHVE